MKEIKLVLIFVSFTILTACEKDEEHAVIEENNNIQVELVSTETFEIINSEFDVYIYGFDPNFQDVPATLITQKKINSTKIPFLLNIEIPENAAEKIEYILENAEPKYYLSIRWDSDGNGKICNGDLSIDYDAMFPYIFINKTETQPIKVMTINLSPCE